jgi:hypothetical protein
MASTKKRDNCARGPAKEPVLQRCAGLVGPHLCMGSKVGRRRVMARAVQFRPQDHRSRIALLLEWGRIPSGEEFLLKKVRALKGLGREEETLLVLNALEDLNPSLAEITLLRTSIKSTAMKWGIGTNHATDRFSDSYPSMSTAFLQVNRRTAFGSSFARFNFASRFGTSGLQVETDIYRDSQTGYTVT